jgi:hypothetical protein
MKKDYKKYIDAELIEKVLSDLNRVSPIMKPKTNYNKEQWIFFSENMNHYMFNVALYIFKQKNLDDIALNIIKNHISEKDYNMIKVFFSDLYDQIHLYYSNLKQFKNLDEIQIINFIYCEMFCDEYNQHMKSVSDLCNWLEYSGKFVETMLIKEIKEKYKKN